MRRLLTALAITAAAGLAASPAIGQGASPAPGAQNPAGQQQITIDQARKIAETNGMATIRSIELDDGKWEVEGRDAQNRKREMEIDARTGQIVKFSND
ncbi:MAG TPA: PepSY domain-containing protein [Xanthobacteraceae bacterium]|nr:PepSY domain-containing protein [Xanthobacteraceae bacterium]